MLELPPSDVPLKAAVANVPLIRQADYHCGPAALAMAMQWSGGEATQNQIARQAFSPGARGTFQADMLGAARRNGYLATPVTGFDALTREVAAGHPVVVFQNLGLTWAPVWHYAVVVGYDLPSETVTLHSGRLDRTTMSLRKFAGTWSMGERWAITVLPPDRLPAAAQERDVLSAAAGLERAGRSRAAARAYRAGASRWPDSWLWPFGLGNALYASGDPQGARRAYERSIQLDPTAPEPRQNLETLMAELRG